LGGKEITRGVWGGVENRNGRPGRERNNPWGLGRCGKQERAAWVGIDNKKAWGGLKSASGLLIVKLPEIIIMS